MLGACDRMAARDVAPSYASARPTISTAGSSPLNDQQIRRFIRGATIQVEASRPDFTVTYFCEGGMFINGTSVPVEIENGYVVEGNQVCRQHGATRSCFRVYQVDEYFYGAMSDGAEASLLRVVGRERCN